jgi:hypothetical protein
VCGDSRIGAASAPRGQILELIMSFRGTSAHLESSRFCGVDRHVMRPCRTDEPERIAFNGRSITPSGCGRVMRSCDTVVLYRRPAGQCLMEATAAD